MRLGAYILIHRLYFECILYFAGATAINPSNIKTLLANAISTYSINGNPALGNGPEKLRKPPSRLIIF